MWVKVTDASNGQVITNASFPWLEYYNNGDGTYAVGVGLNGAFACTAPGFYDLWSNSDTYAMMYLAMQKKPTTPPDPSPNCNCWT